MAQSPDLAAMVEPDDLTGDLALVAQECGLDVAVKLWEGMKGTVVNVPKNGLQRVVMRYVRKFYNGRNASELAVRCGISERQVYAILEDAPIKNDQYRLV
jgi:Mor family transcriptional regulator